VQLCQLGLLELGEFRCEPSDFDL
jgi:hypothetical protein